MSDQVTLALIAVIPTVVTNVAMIVITVLTRRNVNNLRDEVQRESQFKGAYMEMIARHPDDVPHPLPPTFHEPTTSPRRSRGTR